MYARLAEPADVDLTDIVLGTQLDQGFRDLAMAYYGFNLQARGFYSGTVTGEMDTRTQRAIRRYQAPQGLDSSILSLSAARKLGLVAVDSPEAD